MEGKDKPQASSIRAFVKHPPLKVEVENYEVVSQPNLIVLETEIAAKSQDDSWLAALLLHERFKESGNPVHAIESIIACHEVGVYPPLPILNWLVSSLKEWHDKGGRISMDTAMKLKGFNGGNTSNAMREAINEQLEQDLMLEIGRLHYTFEISISKAANMVSIRLQETDWNKTIHKLKDYSTSTLQTKYKKRKCREWWRPDIIETFRAMTEAEKMEMLSHYPRHAYEYLPRMKRYLSQRKERG